MDFVILQAMLSDWQIRDFEFGLAAFWDTASIRGNRNVLVDLSLPHEIKIEITTILQNDCLCLSLIDEEVAKIELMWLPRRHLHSARAC